MKYMIKQGDDYVKEVNVNKTVLATFTRKRKEAKRFADWSTANCAIHRFLDDRAVVVKRCGPFGWFDKVVH